MKKIFTLLVLTIGFSMNAQTGNTSTGTGALASLTSGGDYNVAHGQENSNIFSSWKIQLLWPLK